VAGVVVALGVLTAVLMPASFSAEARLLPLGTGVYDTREANGPPQPGQVLDPTSVTNVELQLLGSLDLHRNLVREGLDRAPTRRRSTRRWKSSKPACTLPRSTTPMSSP
jgi:uncharacterized protein involved in exopolysaccharide biosynthesis